MNLRRTFGEEVRRPDCGGGLRLIEIGLGILTVKRVRFTYALDCAPYLAVEKVTADVGRLYGLGPSLRIVCPAFGLAEPFSIICWAS